ncbi:hypothetical protein GQ53DRAFT_630476, partial [Thozetella sp. PMI_491]
MSNEQINVPSLVVILVLSGLIIRYLFFSPSTPSAERQQRDAAAHLRAREAAVERIQQMFPQVDRRTILWDLQRNGGNVAMTTERILAGRMETPPISFQPPPPPAPPAGASTTTATHPSGSQQARAAEKPAQPDLITRYNLQNKLQEQVEAAPEGKAWSSNRDERQSLLQRRRDQMILEARRKMEAKMKAEK